MTNSDPAVEAALAARAKMQRLLAAPTPFAGDDGSLTPELAAALERYEAASGPDRHREMDSLWQVLVSGRILMPVEPHARDEARPGREEDPEAGVLTVDLPDGHVALPVFSSAEALLTWNPAARPVPVAADRAAQLAVAHADSLWVLDPGTRDLRLPRPAVVALAGGEAWVPSWRAGLIQQELQAQLGEVEGVLALGFEPGDRAELRILVGVDAAGGMRQAAAVLEACQLILVNPAWGDLIDTVELAPVPMEA